MSSIFVTLVRPGKSPKTVSAVQNDTLQTVLMKGNITESDYAGWNFTDEDGDTLNLSDSLSGSTQIICGTRVDGA